MKFQFKVPETIPQDLLLIQDLVGPISSPDIDLQRSFGPSQDSSDESIGSSDNDVDSEEEVEAGLLRDNENVTQPQITSPASESDLDSDSESSSSSASEDDRQPRASAPSFKTLAALDPDDEDFETPAATACLQTKNEIVDTDIIVPTVSEVGPDDNLEKVGEIMSIVGNIVIVKGLPADQVKTLSERALDAESLLVFEDRRVLGYIYETFGPTSQPMYQIKFNQDYPLDSDKVRVAREVFHVPNRSHFVFVDQLKNLRGSDASNIHDEEPAEDELEFSDDEQEAAFKQRRRKRNGHSASSSRQPSPASSRSRIDVIDDEGFYGANPYDAHGPYDDDFSMTRPSRPPPMPYDDPYTEPTGMETITHSTERSSAEGEHHDRYLTHEDWDNGRDNTQNSPVLRQSRDPRPGRGLRGKADRSRHSFRRARRKHDSKPAIREGTSTLARSLTPMPFGGDFAAEHITPDGAAHSSVQPALASWSYPPNNPPAQHYYQHFVQPHINPRFASAFGLSMQGVPGQWQQHQTSPYLTLPSQQNWTDQWTVHDNTGGNRDIYGPT